MRTLQHFIEPNAERAAVRVVHFELRADRTAKEGGARDAVRLANDVEDRVLNRGDGLVRDPTHDVARVALQLRHNLRPRQRILTHHELPHPLNHLRHPNVPLLKVLRPPHNWLALRRRPIRADFHEAKVTETCAAS